MKICTYTVRRKTFLENFRVWNPTFISFQNVAAPIHSSLKQGTWFSTCEIVNDFNVFYHGRSAASPHFESIFCEVEEYWCYCWPVYTVHMKCDWIKFIGSRINGASSIKVPQLLSWVELYANLRKKTVEIPIATVYLTHFSFIIETAGVQLIKMNSPIICKQSKFCKQSRPFTHVNQLMFLRRIEQR